MEDISSLTSSSTDDGADEQEDHGLPLGAFSPGCWELADVSVRSAISGAGFTAGIETSEGVPGGEGCSSGIDADNSVVFAGLNLPCAGAFPFADLRFGIV